MVEYKHRIEKRPRECANTPRPGPRKLLEETVIEKSLARPARTVPEETRERDTCSGCGTTTKTLTIPRPNVGHGYEGPRYCLSCKPRFFTLDAQWSGLKRMVG